MGLSLAPAPGGRRHAFRIALRMARRDIRRHKGRSLLIILLIMLPVAAMTGALTLFESTQETAAERVEYQLGTTQARFRAMAAPNSSMVQDPVDETRFDSANWDSDPAFTPRDPREMIPAGYTVLTESEVELSAEAGAADVPLLGRAVDALDPAFTGKYTLLQGRAPANDTEILVSPGLLDRFGLDLGEDLTTSAGTFVAAGTLRDAGYSDNNSIAYLRPGQGASSSRDAAPPAAGTAAATLRSTFYYVVGPEPVTWNQIRAANAAGVAVLSRSVALDPPLPDQRPPASQGAQSAAAAPLAAYAGGALLGALALLEVGLLAGASFAVGAKGQVRDLALLAATGAEPPTIRSVVMAAGLWLGGIGVAAGAVLGLAAAAVVVGVFRLNGSVRFPGFHPDAPLTVLVMAMGFAACLLAALAPAWQVARQAVLGALKSGRAPAPAAKASTVLGSILLGVAAAALAAGTWLAVSSGDPDVFAARTPVIAWLLLGGAVLGVTSLVLLTGTVVRILARLAGRLPLAGRMAARDASRNRSRTVPAVAAVLAAATLASAGMVMASSQQANEEQNHQWSGLRNQAVLPLFAGQPALADGTVPEPVPVDPATLVSALKGVLDTVEWTHVLRTPAIRNCETRPERMDGTPAQTATSSCLQYSLATPAGNECPVTAGQRVLDPDDWRCRGAMRPHASQGSVDSMVVGTAEDVERLFGKTPTAEARDVLAAGGMVVTNPAFVRNGHASLVAHDVRTPQPSVPGSDAFQGFREAGRTEVAAAVLEPAVSMHYYGVISPAAAAAAGMRVESDALLVQLSAYPDAAQMDKVTSAFAGVYKHRYASMYVERGAERDASLVLWSIVGLGALITLSAAGITTGLSMADSRKDHVTLAGVGAAPRLRKALAGSQALMTAGLGTVLGSVAGTIPALLLVTSTGMARTAVVPWLQLVALLVAVPLTGAALAWLFTRAKLPVSRREVGT
ncbi:FtsX-like permease family protein [Pseudarthrobacter sulfonivorans]|uniref:FtsX-like permease family protein n=1 Tax=Pseudarthrobacter sulfonivorans TaxID=121292 RepID=UPI002102C66E|nr:FtsX-like permease family protein [Pseudarthrobacter sulfonivorans]